MQVVSFHDPVLAGANFECTDLYEWQRRPGFSIFCSQRLPDAEVVNQFYSFRNLDGEVVPMYDSTVQLAQFSSTTITPIITKTTTAQGFVAPVGNLLYFADGAGVDLQKWDSVEPLSTINPSSWGLAAPTVTPSLTALGCWLPLTNFGTDSAILDPNGAVEVAFISAAATIADTMAYTAQSVINIPGSYNPQWFYNAHHPVPGQNFWSTTTPAGQHSSYISFQGFGFNIPTGATIVGIVASIAKQGVANNSSAYEIDYSVKLTLAGTPSGVDHASATHWPQTIGGAPISDGSQYISYGSSSDTWGLSLMPSDINNSGFGIALAAQAPGPGDYPNVNGSPYPTRITVYYRLPSSGSAVGRSGLNEPTWSTILNSPTQDGTISWTNVGPLLIWYPGTNYPTPAVIVDTNGNLELATQATVPIEAWDSGTAYAVGDEVAFGGVYWVAVAASTGVAPAALYTVVTMNTTQPSWIQVPNPITTGLTAPVWNTTQGGTTTDGDYTWTNIGQGNLVESFGTSYVFGFRTIYGHLTTCSPISISTGSIFGPQSVGITAFSITDAVVTFTGTNNFIPGNMFTVYGFTTGIYLNGQPFTVLAAGLSTTSFSANFTYPDTGSTNDTASTQPLIATVMGVGTSSALCNATATITAIGVIADVVTISAVNSFSPGLFVTFTGITNSTWLNNQQLQVINVDPAGQWFQVYVIQPNQPVTADTGMVTFNAVEIYRVSDGGGIYLFAGAVTNPGAGVSWTYNDFTTDADLDILLIAPQNHQNDPPPGAPGSTIPTAGTVVVYWQGRLWMIVGNYVYFDAGPDCTNGIPEEAWPPGNRFQFAGPPFNLEVTEDGVGLLVYLADRVNVILGGPDTISFYPTDALSNFGISTPNAIFRDGSTIGQFTTQKQYMELIGSQKQETSEHIADYIAANFTAADAYVTFHRDGEDVGVFISNGTDQILRFGSNISAWSVPAYPVMGAGALRSIETSVGITSLMLASPTGGVSGQIGFKNPQSGMNGGGSNIAWTNPNNITLGVSSDYATVSLTSQTSQQLIASNFAMQIPANAIIRGVEVSVTGTQSISPVSSNYNILAGVQLNGNGTTSGTTPTITPVWAAWSASTSYTAQIVVASHAGRILDSNGNIQTVIVSGTSKSGTHPVWATGIGQPTTDGTVTWRNDGSGANIINIGDVLLFWIYVQPSSPATVTGVTDSLGNTWSAAAPALQAGGNLFQLWYVVTAYAVANNTGFTISAAFSQTKNSGAACQFCTVTGVTAPLAQNSGAIGNLAGSDPNDISPGNLTIPAAALLVNALYAANTGHAIPSGFISCGGAWGSGANNSVICVDSVSAGTYNPVATGFPDLTTQYATSLVAFPLISNSVSLTLAPIAPVVGATVHLVSLGATNTTQVFGSSSDLWGMAWGTPSNINIADFGFTLTAANPSASATVFEVSLLQVKVFYQAPGNYLYARDLDSWGDGGAHGANNGTPYSDCEITVGSITLAQPGAVLFPLQHVVGYFDAVGTLNNGGPSRPNIWILPNEISDTAGVGFVQLPEVLPEPPQGVNYASQTLLALRYPVNMANSQLMSQFIAHLQVKIQFDQECAPNTIKALSFKEMQE